MYFIFHREITSLHKRLSYFVLPVLKLGMTYLNNSKNAINGVSLEVIRTANGQIDKLVEIVKAELN